MRKKKLILEAGADGGSVKMVQINNYFIYSTNETTLREFVPELTLEELKSKSNIFLSFNLAMESLLAKYRIFALYPLSVHPDFKTLIIPYYLETISKIEDQERRINQNWKELLYENRNIN